MKQNSSVPVLHTKVVAVHEVSTGVLRVGTVHLSGYRVEPCEVVSMETVVVLQPAKNGGANRQLGPCLGLHCLRCNIVNVNIMSCGVNY